MQSFFVENFLRAAGSVTRKLCYRKDDRARAM